MTLDEFRDKTKDLPGNLVLHISVLADSGRYTSGIDDVNAYPQERGECRTCKTVLPGIDVLELGGSV